MGFRKDDTKPLQQPELEPEEPKILPEQAPEEEPVLVPA